jgi:hypothetical protein
MCPTDTGHGFRLTLVKVTGLSSVEGCPDQSWDLVREGIGDTLLVEITLAFSPDGRWEDDV